MEREELERLITKGESETLEFKVSTGQLIEAGKTLCGFLNHKGGRVLIGINDNKEIIGQQVSDKTQQDIAHILNELTPSAPITWDMIELPNSQKKLISLKTNALIPAAVYHFKGKAYERVGTTTITVKYERLRQLMLERAFDRVWDQMPAKEYSIADLDHEAIRKTVKDGVACGRIDPNVVPQEDIAAILQGLELNVNGYLTNAAVVLFAKKMSDLYVQCELKMAHFIGTTKSVGFTDEKRVVGHAFKILEEGEAFVRRHLNISMTFTPDSFQRIDTPQLPFMAVREALINAICHRDYIYQAGSISLAIFEDRLELWNMGELPLPLQYEDLKKSPHPSIPRNTKISHVFFLRKYIEKWGSGTTRIIDLCKELGVPEPEYFQNAGGFCVCFRFKTEGSTILETKIFTDLTAKQRKILDILKTHPQGLPVRELLAFVAADMSHRTLKRELKNLNEINKVSTEGKGRGTIWKLIKS